MAVNSSHAFDLYGEEKTSTIVYFKNDEIRKSFHLQDSGLSLRINEEGRTGFSGCSLNIVEGEKLIQDASPPSNIPSDCVHLDFPRIEQHHVKDIYDPDIAACSVEDIKELVQSVVTSASHENIASVDGYVRLFSKKWIIGNYHGEQACVEETYIKVMVRVYARLLFKNAIHVEYQDGRRLEQIDPVHLGELCAEKALKSLNSKKMEPADLSVVLDPSLVSNLMYSIATGMLNAGSVLRKVSCLDET
jgi:predicted Zn-dependent protease